LRSLRAFFARSLLGATDESRRAWAPFRRALLPSLAAAGIGLALSLGAWLVVSAREDRLADLEFTGRARNHALVLQNGINDYLDRITALRALFHSSSDVTRQEFATFSDTLLDGQTAMLAVSWIPRVLHAERAAHEEAAMRDGLAGYRIKSATPQGLVPAPVRDEYFPVFYSPREAPDSPVFGLDLNDGGLRQQPLERARDRDRMATSESFLLRSGIGDREGVETADQFERLKAEGCTEAQGYFFSPPRPAAEVRAMLTALNPKLRAIA
jgi:CHASE1-domain containing sensor protein